MLKPKFVSNLAALGITNSSLETEIFNPKEKLGILYLRSIRCYKIKLGILQKSLSKYFRFVLVDVLCDQFNKFVNTLR